MVSVFVEIDLIFQKLYFFFFFEVSGVSGHVLRVRLYTLPKSAMNLGAAVKRIYRKMLNANEYKLNLSNKKKARQGRKK